MRAAIVLSIAMVCHEANRQHCLNNGDNSQKHWDEAEEWQRESAIKGVEFRLDNPRAGHDAQHNAWMEDKIAQGWVYGDVKDANLKTHPCIVPFGELPEYQQQKDALFGAIVDALTPREVIEARPLTFGQKAVGLKFNPSNLGSVDKCKQLSADLIDQANDFRSRPDATPGQKRHASVAITDLETAQMRGVKALTWTED